MIIIIVCVIITISMLVIFYELYIKCSNRQNEVINLVPNDIEIKIPEKKSYEIYNEKISIPNIKPFDYMRYDSIDKFSDENKLNNNTIYNRLITKDSIIINSDSITRKKYTENTQLLSPNDLTRSLSENDTNKYKREYENIVPKYETIGKENRKKVVLINV